MFAKDYRRYLDQLRHRITPINWTIPRNLDDPTGRKGLSGHNYKIIEYIDGRLGARRNGFFIECGSMDGEQWSESLFFEIERNWTGLLIEANPGLYRSLVRKNRRAHTFYGCVSTDTKPVQVTFLSAGGGAGGIFSHLPASQRNVEKPAEQLTNHTCIPLGDILTALGFTDVDVLFLDVEGPEAKILKTIDWSETKIDLIVTEHHYRPDSLRDLREVMLQGTAGQYRESFCNLAIDIAFERVDLKPPFAGVKSKATPWCK
jgi:hypothetical protein